ncbi:MAG: CDP-alcohol phosphatidyltransferase family protein [Candidatus Diapherotrites archaeon]|nr:CDP-alcohol phosphatidyltransferase family protein [Candidatus Diapherotrites archaeon]
MLSARYRHVFKPIFERVAKYVGVHPNIVTLTSLAFAGLAAWYYAQAEWLIGSIVAAIAGILDALDGAVARYWKRESKWGAYLDAITDRVVEALILFGVGWGSSYWAPVYIIMFASILISYAKARAAMETHVDNINWPDLFERAERLILLIVGIPIAAALRTPEIDTLYIYLWILALAYLCIGATQRILRVRKRLLEE